MGFTINNFGGISLLITITFLILIGTGFIAFFSHFFTKYALITLVDKTLGKKHAGLGKIIFDNRLFHRIAYLVPALLLHHYSYLFNYTSANLTLLLSELVEQITYIYILIVCSFVLSALLNCVHDRYNLYPIAKIRPIKSYLQVIKILLFSVTGILVLSNIFDKSPMYFFTGVGATTAFLAFVFKDSVMGFVASIQLAAYDMVRIGDWIEMPNFGADGEVMEISLNTVKVQNFDKTIVTIPSYALLTSGLKNWRGMHEAGGRRVKRGIIIDINSIKMMNESLLEQLSHLIPSIKTKHNSSKKSVTNIGLFRSYLENYLIEHPSVHKNMRILIRQMQGTPTGLPLELYFFTNETDSKQYESIQSDIIEHVYAIMPQFELRAFQYANSME